MLKLELNYKPMNIIKHPVWILFWGNPCILHYFVVEHLLGGRSMGHAAYFQVLQEVSTVKRLQWTLENEGLDFDDIFRMDECTVQLESHRHFVIGMLGRVQGKSQGKPTKQKINVMLRKKNTCFCLPLILLIVGQSTL